MRQRGKRRCPWGYRGNCGLPLRWVGETSHSGSTAWKGGATEVPVTQFTIARRSRMLYPIARMAKLADAGDLKSPDRKVLRVRVPLRAITAPSCMQIRAIPARCGYRVSFRRPFQSTPKSFLDDHIMGCYVPALGLQSPVHKEMVMSVSVFNNNAAIPALSGRRHSLGASFLAALAIACGSAHAFAQTAPALSAAPILLGRAAPATSNT